MKYDLIEAELYNVSKVQKKFKWVDAQLNQKILISLPLVQEEGEELWTLVERQLIWASFNWIQLWSDVKSKKEYI